MKIKARCEDRVYFDVIIDTDELEGNETLEELVGRTLFQGRRRRVSLDLYQVLKYSSVI